VDVFEQAFKVVIGHEGGYTTSPADPGNWTSGRCGTGVCRGTNFGLSAAAYPQLDIAALTLGQAQTIYRRDYWERVQCDKLPASLALLVFDAAVNNGVVRAARWLQSVVKVPQTGMIDSVTLAAIESQAGNGFRLCAEFQANRLIFMAGLATWKTFGDGWARRLCMLPFEALHIGAVS